MQVLPQSHEFSRDAGLWMAALGAPLDEGGIPSMRTVRGETARQPGQLSQRTGKGPPGYALAPS